MYFFGTFASVFVPKKDLHPFDAHGRQKLVVMVQTPR